jgi:ABC-2 type transport system permease protein
MKSNKQQSAAAVIIKRELAAYFTSPIAYIVCGLFLVFSGFLFFNTFFLVNRAELRNFFILLPITLSFFVPALTMRQFAEEKRSGSLETLLTLPVTPFSVVLGKFVATWISSTVMLVPTVFYVLTCVAFGSPDAGPIIGGYLGALFLIAAFCAIGLFASSITKNQIIAFFVAFAICIFLAGLGYFLVFFPPAVVSLFSFFSATDHFNSISRGIIDTRDLLYFISVTALFFTLTVQTLKNDRS